MFGLDVAELLLVLGFAGGVLGSLIRISMQCGRILQRLAAGEARADEHGARLDRHGHRITRLELLHDPNHKVSAS